MKDRIREIRKDNGLTQVEFGERIGVKGNTITNYENGLRNPTDAVLLLICREFKINEQWLRTGKGRKEVLQEERYAVNIGKLQRADNETIMRWVNAIAETSPETLIEIEKFMKKILEID